MLKQQEFKWAWLFIPSTIIGGAVGLMVGIIFHGPAWAAYGFGITNWYLSFFTAAIAQMLDH
jgi:hypothetical protein